MSVVVLSALADSKIRKFQLEQVKTCSFHNSSNASLKMMKISLESRKISIVGDLVNIRLHINVFAEVCSQFKKFDKSNLAAFAIYRRYLSTDVKTLRQKIIVFPECSCVKNATLAQVDTCIYNTICSRCQSISKS